MLVQPFQVFANLQTFSFLSILSQDEHLFAPVSQFRTLLSGKFLNLIFSIADQNPYF
jgi:hypothetical protein